MPPLNYLTFPLLTAALLNLYCSNCRTLQTFRFRSRWRFSKLTSFEISTNLLFCWFKLSGNKTHSSGITHVS